MTPRSPIPKARFQQCYHVTLSEKSNHLQRRFESCCECWFELLEAPEQSNLGGRRVASPLKSISQLVNLILNGNAVRQDILGRMQCVPHVLSPFWDEDWFNILLFGNKELSMGSCCLCLILKRYVILLIDLRHANAYEMVGVCKWAHTECVYGFTLREPLLCCL